MIELDGDGVRLALRDDSPIFSGTDDDFTWLASCPGAGDRSVLALAQGFERRATVTL